MHRLERGAGVGTRSADESWWRPNLQRAKFTIYYNADVGRNCARLDKTQDVGQKSYLKLSLCNSTTGTCDRDWNYYTHYAAPVSVTARGHASRGRLPY